jgi:aryl-alcohol dehydrogenase-like predicted oxidoreductase
VNDQTMPTRQLGGTDLELTTLGFGAWAIGGGGWSLGWGPQDDAESIAAIEGALDAGMNWIDTAPVYGLGHSEKVIGQALRGRSDRPLIATKCGRIEDPDGAMGLGTDLTRDGIRRELETSLKLLGVDSVDMYLIHWPDDNVAEGWNALAEIKSEGLTRAIGVCNFSLEQMQLAQSIAPIDVCQPPYSMIDRAIEAEILPFCREHGIGIVAYSPQASGMLTGAITRERLASLPKEDWRISMKVPRFHEPELTRNLALVELLKEIGARHGRSPGEVAIAWVLACDAVSSAIVGLRRPDQLDGVIGAAAFVLSADEVSEIETFLNDHELSPPPGKEVAA